MVPYDIILNIIEITLEDLNLKESIKLLTINKVIYDEIYSKFIRMYFPKIICESKISINLNTIKSEEFISLLNNNSYIIILKKLLDYFNNDKTFEINLNLVIYPEKYILTLNFIKLLESFLIDLLFTTKSSSITFKINSFRKDNNKWNYPYYYLEWPYTLDLDIDSI